MCWIYWRVQNLKGPAWNIVQNNKAMISRSVVRDSTIRQFQFNSNGRTTTANSCWQLIMNRWECAVVYGSDVAVPQYLLLVYWTVLWFPRWARCRRFYYCTCSTNCESFPSQRRILCRVYSTLIIRGALIITELVDHRPFLSHKLGTVDRNCWPRMGRRSVIWGPKQKTNYVTRKHQLVR